MTVLIDNSTMEREMNIFEKVYYWLFNKTWPRHGRSYYMGFK